MFTVILIGIIVLEAVAIAGILYWKNNKKQINKVLGQAQAQAQDIIKQAQSKADEMLKQAADTIKK